MMVVFFSTGSVVFFVVTGVRLGGGFGGGSEVNQPICQPSTTVTNRTTRAMPKMTAFFPDLNSGAGGFWGDPGGCLSVALALVGFFLLRVGIGPAALGPAGITGFGGECGAGLD